MRNHLLEEVTSPEKVETIDYICEQDFDDKPSKTKVIEVVGLSKSTYYSIKNHKPSKTEIKRTTVMSEIHREFFKWDEVYGAPKLHKELVKIHGDDFVSLRSVTVYMNKMGLFSITVPKFKGCSNKEQQLPFNIPMVNYLKTDRSDKPHTHIVTDMTYIYTISEGWTYLLTYMDLYTRKILAWDLSDNMTANWVTDIAKELIQEYPTIEYIHSDRGSQYTSKVYLEFLLTNGVAPSFSSKGYPYHNAWIESFHAQLKKECIYRRTLKDVRDAKLTCFNYIEGFYNTIRSQKALGYISPNEFEAQHKEVKTKNIKLGTIKKTWN